MITGIFHEGSGLGNQLFRYIFTRTKAADLGVDFTMKNPENFKGKPWMPLNMGVFPGESPKTFFQEQRINHVSGADIRPYDPLTEKIQDGTQVDGEFQAEKYFEHRKAEIRDWLQTTAPVPQINDNVCIINFRGGEYVGVEDLFLPQAYWKEAIRYMGQKYPGIKFKVVTDDIATAKKFFHLMPMSHEISEDWMSIRIARYLILSNSSFAILPAWLNENVQEIVAPKFWAGRNVGYWKLPQNEYKGWTYL